MTTSWNRNDPGSQLEALQREISEKERIEEELRIKERMLSEAERLAQVGSWEWNPTSNRVRGSDEFNRIYGFEPGTEVAPEQILSRVHPEDREEVEQEWVRTINDRDGQKVEYRYEYAPTKFRTIYADSRIIENEHGQITRMAGMVRDITEERRAQAALAASEERYRTFIRQSLEGMASRSSHPFPPICRSSSRYRGFSTMRSWQSATTRSRGCTGSKRSTSS